MSVRPGLIFDLDETLITTGDTWHEMHAHCLGPYGYERTPEVHDKITGLNVLDQARVVHDLFDIPVDVPTLQQQMRDRLIHNFQTCELQAMPGAVDMVHRLRGLGPMSVASGSPLPGIQIAIERLDLQSDITMLVSSESVDHGKPAPDVFLKAAEQMEADPQHCVVFEDSAHGAEAAKAAGMKCIVCATPHGSATIEHARPFATWMVESWNDVTRQAVADMLTA